MQNVNYPIQSPVPNGNQSHLRAKKNAFDFGSSKKELEILEQKRESILSEMKTPPTPVKSLLCVVAIFVAIVLGLVEANNVKMSIVAATGLSEGIAMLVGWGFCCLGLLLGEMVSSVGSFKTDEYTGRKRPTVRFYIATFLIVVYIVGQVILASRAGMGASDDMKDTVNTMTIFICIIAVIEVIFGILFLRPCFQMVSLFLNKMRAKPIMRKMTALARQTDEYWNRHIFDCQTNGIQPQEESDNVKAARNFFNNSGFGQGNNQTLKN